MKEQTPLSVSGRVGDGEAGDTRPLLGHLAAALHAQLSAMEGDSPAPRLADALLRDAARERATDLHLDAQSRGILVRLRIDGVLHDAALLDHEPGKLLVNQLKALARLDPVIRFVAEDARLGYELDGEMLDLRLTRAPCLHGDKLSIRLFDRPIMPHQLQELGLHAQGLEELQEWLGSVSGMLLVAGPSGSGKTTTLYALLHRLKLHERSVITVEDPVEYQVDGINHIQIDKFHGMTFVEGVKAMLRLDPDFLMLGEIRDSDSAHAALTAASSGRALMSTLHSRDAVAVIETLRNYGLSGHDIATNLMLVVSQRLVRRLCPHCRVEAGPNNEEKHWLHQLGRPVPKRVWHARGCERCHGVGYRGRIGLFEVWRIDAEEYQLILQEGDRRTLYRHLAGRGHRFLLDDGLAKVQEGLTTLGELRVIGGYNVLRTLKLDD
ncbi:MAG: GspE/PulE family protein [Gammaproteobacteria bacterium]|nr:GspE/PulE family protein [Gammaproteobacteria bacterium]